MQTPSPHLCQPEYRRLLGMREFYKECRLLPTSETADISLIRSHIAYWSGNAAAERASIKASRGHSYRVAPYGKHTKSDVIVRISDHYDHRLGVSGWTQTGEYRSLTG